jgi:hypothetical protein
LPGHNVLSQIIPDVTRIVNARIQGLQGGDIYFFKASLMRAKVQGDRKALVASHRK